MSAGHGQVEFNQHGALKPRAIGRIAATLFVSMQRSITLSTSTLRVLACMFLICVAPACSRFPAIDPNGQSIFLPHPAATELRVPQIHATQGNPGIIPQEAFVTPQAPPPCLDGSCVEPSGIHNLFNHKKKKAAIANHFAKKDPSKCGEIQLSPLRIVAPVNGEVLLLAGICGKDGYLLKREPLEWMLAPGSVGQFIEVGDDAKGQLCSSLRSGPKVEKLGVDYARGRTSSKETLLTKGTPGCDDDVQVVEGQTWLSISSPNEGVSRVTVLAPDSELWDRRRQTATIYWVDSQANFPAAQVVRSPGPVQLVTRVTQSENLVPAAGWQVRYTIVDPNVAGFVPPIQTNIYVAPVDASGQAIVNIAAPPGGRGTTPVHMEVIRPARPSENLPELVLHQADTFVTFSSPGLLTTASGPQTAAVGDVVEYLATMANPGDIDAENARLIAILPAGTQLIEAIPAPSREANGSLLWDQGLLAAGRQLDVLVRLRLDAAQDVAIQFRSEGAPDLRSDAAPVVTRVVAPSVNVRFAPAAENTRAEAEIGEVLLYEIDVVNAGTQTLVNLEMEIETSPGWQHADAARNVVTKTIPVLAPGQRDSSGVALRVIQQGQHTARLRIRSAAGANVIAPEATVAINGVPRRERTPVIETSVRMQPQAFVGTPVMATVLVSNRGETTLNNIQVSIAHDAALQPFEFDNTNTGLVSRVSGQRLLNWTPPALAPGQYARLIINCQTTAPIEQAALVATATSGGVTSTAQAQVRLLPSQGSVAPGTGGAPGAVVPPVTPGTAPNTTPGAAPATNAGPTQPGNWEIQIIDLNDPTVVGIQRSYTIVLNNKQNMQDANVRIEIQIPEGVNWNGVSDGLGTPINAAFNPQNRSYVLEDIRFVRSNDSLRRVFSLTPQVPQQMVLRVRVSSDVMREPKLVEERVTVIAR